MNKGQLAFVISVVIAVISAILLKVMYVIDPITQYGGFLTAFCFIFVNVPFWIISLFLFIYSLAYLFKHRKYKGISEDEGRVDVGYTSTQKKETHKKR